MRSLELEAAQWGTTRYGVPRPATQSRPRRRYRVTGRATPAAEPAGGSPPTRTGHPGYRPVRGPLREILPLSIEQVRRSEQEPLFNSLMEQYHYLRYEQPVGEHLKYLVKTRGQVIACLAWSSAPRHLGSRDRFIGWDAEARRRNIHLIAYNTRFLILPKAMTFCYTSLSN